MEHKVEKLEKGKIKINITVSPKEMVSYFNRAYEKLSPGVKLDGFRPGKAPRKLVEASLGVARILSEGLDIAINEAYVSVIRGEKFIPITQPKIVINKYPSYGREEKEVKDALEFEIEMETLPPYKLKDYSSVSVKKGELKKATKEDLEKVLSHFQKQNSDFKEVDRGAKKGDHVEVSFEGFLKGVRIDQMCSKNHPLILGEKTMIPGFEEEIVGLKKGDKKEFKIKFPKDYHSKEYAGREALFKVGLNNLKEITLPKLDDEFAKKFGHNNMDELKKAIEKNLNMELKDQHEKDTESRVMDAMISKLDAEIPETLIDRETERMFGDFSSRLTSQGINVEQYLASMKKTKEEILKEMRPQAEKNVKVGLILGKIIEEKKWDQNNPEVGRKAIQYLVKKIAK